MGKMLFSSLICLILFTACAKIEEPRFKEVSAFQLRKLGLEDVTIGFGMTYFNPNNFSVTVKETAVKVYLDSVFLGDFIQDTTVAVASNADFTVPLSGTIPMATFFQLNVKDIHKRQVLVQANGSTKVGKAGIFLTKKIVYEGKHRLSQLKLQ
jgi:LEA14-like dessication related protein